MVKRALGFLLTVTVIVFVACAAPRVIVQDYVPVLFLNANEPRAIGKMECDVFGHPIVYVHPAISLERRAWVLVHERLHVGQTKVNGGCEPFQLRMQRDSLFRLEMEAGAYCGVLEAQRFTNARQDPDYAQIVDILREKYYAAYDSLAVVQALLPCRR